MGKLTQTRDRVRKRASIFRAVSVPAFIISWLALAPLGGQSSSSGGDSLFWLFIHLLSYALMGFTVFLQAKALSYDHTKVDIGLLLGIHSSSGEKSCLMLPIMAVCIMVDLGTLFLL